MPQAQTATRPRAEDSAAMQTLQNAADAYDEIDSELAEVESDIADKLDEIQQAQQELAELQVNEAALIEKLNAAYETYDSAADANEEAGEEEGYGISQLSNYSQDQHSTRYG
jgi:uncharacterized protein involved in exopolysaccharide biosynthesis